jgi:Tfp pilus assembly protein PilF
MIALKRLSKLLLTKKDYSSAFIFLNTAIKLDNSEADLWQMLSLYYLSNGDNAKYYECILKEMENSKNHANSFLFSLLPKVII